MLFIDGSPLWKLWRWVLRWSLHYRGAFNTPDGQAVLVDLAKFCYANAPCHSEREQGRRDVWLRIQQHLNLPPDELTILFAKLGPEDRQQLFNGPSATFIQE